MRKRTMAGQNKVDWTELKTQGVKRCCAMFSNGKQCTHRANSGGSWCDKHAAIIEPAVSKALRAINSEANATVQDCLTDED